MPLDPDIAAELEVIDATLAGDPVDPAHADLAELALLLADERPRPEAAFAARLDDRVAARFAPVDRGRTSEASERPAQPVPRWRRALVPAAAAAGALATAAVVVVLIAGGGSSSPVVGATTAVGSSSVATASSPGVAALSAPARSDSASGSGTSSGNTGSAGSTASSGSPGAVLQPPPNGRKIVQSAQLALTTGPSHVDDVAQEVFNVVGIAGGIVNSSTVTATPGSDGYAQFQLSIPSSAMPQTMASLSRLRYASVASRTDATQDVNDEYSADVSRLVDARALRTALLRQLAAATTSQQIASLKAQIRDAEASIASAQATLRGLQHRISFSQVSVSINAGTPVPVPSSSSHGFTIGRALHDAGRVLAVAAGVAIVALAALVPVALIVALGLWIAALVRRHRREQALDLA